MTEEEIAELKQLAAMMYPYFAESEEGAGVCTEPAGADEACPPGGCSDCGWNSKPVWDALIRLGVDI